MWSQLVCCDNELPWQPGMVGLLVCIEAGSADTLRTRYGHGPEVTENTSSHEHSPKAACASLDTHDQDVLQVPDVRRVVTPKVQGCSRVAVLVERLHRAHHP